MWCQSWRIYWNINQLHVWNMLHQIHKQVFTTLNQYDDAVNTKHLYWVFNRQDQHLTHLSHLVLRAHQYFTCWWFRVFGCQPITALLHVCDLESLLVVMECVWSVFCEMVCWWRRADVKMFSSLCIERRRRSAACNSNWTTNRTGQNWAGASDVIPCWLFHWLVCWWGHSSF